ncbi:MAG: hypothetical protein H6Q37_2592 [Chloroflexi bacterium]|nr:hypothetical protein [Chloroflexota bacterium]
MEILTEDVDRNVLITVLTPLGALDSSNFRQLVAKAEQNYQAGKQFLLLDLSRVHYMSSAGMLALNLIGKLYLGQKPPDANPDWQTMQAIKKERGKVQTNNHVKLLKPQEQVEQVLEMVGFNKLFEVFQDRESALSSFRITDLYRK